MKQQRNGHYCAIHVVCRLSWHQLPNGKLDRRCRYCAPRRCDTDQVGDFGECLACGSWQGEACHSRRLDVLGKIESQRLWVGGRLK